MHLDTIVGRASKVQHRYARIDHLATLGISLNRVADNSGTIIDDVAILIHEDVALVNVLSKSR